MSQNKPTNDTPNTTGTTGTTGGTTGTPGPAGTPGTSTTPGGTGLTTTSTTPTTGGGGGGAATGAAPGLAPRAKEYGQKVAGAATHAKDYLSEKATVVGDKFQELRNKDYQQIAEEAKQYARQNPGQALLISAAAGFVIGLLLRGGRR